MSFAALRIVGQLAEFVGWALLARHLGAAHFGSVSVAFLICRYAGVIADWGASLQGVRDVAARRPPEVIGALVGRRILAGTGLGLLYATGALAYGSARLVPLVLVILSRAIGRDWISLGREKGIRSGLPSTVQGLAIAGLAWTAHDELSGAVVVGLAYLLAGSLSLGMNHLPIRASLRGTGRVASWLLLAVVADQMLSSLDVPMLAAFHSTREAGIYAAVYRVPNAWVTIVGLLVASMIPLAVGQKGGFAQLRSKAVTAGLLGACIAVAAMPAAFVLVPIVFGDAYTAGRPALLILMAAIGVMTMHAPLHSVYLGAGRDRSIALRTLAGAVLNLVANLVLIPVLGMLGAAISTLVAQVFLLILLWRGTADLPGSAGTDLSGWAGVAGRGSRLRGDAAAGETMP